jgi:CRISPR-associated endonuclease/helicase Cas3
MIVTFISECEKKAHKRTRRVLDAFANRIGTNAWQTVITKEGLIAVQKLLKKTATKNTAVSCHKIKSRQLTELLWIVGNKDTFNNEGYVAVNYTQQDFFIGENINMKTIDVIKSATSIAGLFHDFGKANKLFQNKLNPAIKNKKEDLSEPYRHEWVSLRLFQSFIKGNTDNQWLEKLSVVNNENINDYFKIDECFRDGIDGQTNDSHPMIELPPFAQLVAWLILTHHKLPLYPNWKTNNSNNSVMLEDSKEWLESNFTAFWNSYNCKNTSSQKIKDNWQFQELPYQSCAWRGNAKKIAKTAKKFLMPENDYLKDNIFTSHFARLCLILADHYYSSLIEIRDDLRDDTYNCWANTYRDTKEYKQKLDEHLIGVAKNAEKIAQALPTFNKSLKSMPVNNKLTDNVNKKYKEKFGWQDSAKKMAKEVGKSTIENGFFGINIASTGRGKTLANAKIMTVIGQEIGRVRFSVALGLRTLTLQTGLEYRKELDLENELAILVGGIATKELFVNQQENNTKQYTGSESEDSSFDNFNMDYKGVLSDHSLNEWTKEKKNLNKLIQAPVLVSTIDHLIPATEGVRGDHHIPAMLRLFSADLVIDEPDDFNLDDLPALARLVNWAGMLGSRVLLSTATMPPALANALFRAYKAGWSQYAKANIVNWDGDITCAWFDEFNKPKNKLIKKDSDYKKQHNNFIKQRIKNLEKQNNSKHLGEVVNIEDCSDKTIIENLANTIQKNILNLHQKHHINNNSKNISIGLVRMANIDPLVATTKELLTMNAPEDIHIHYLAYHSKFPLAIRSFMENKLDDVLNRKNQDKIWNNPIIKNKIINSNIKNHIFVVLASPVAEVGRDHDYDWAIIEPSSMRSIIQIAGRVLRHRDIQPSEPNIAILNKNYKVLLNKDLCFIKPGFESENIKISEKNYDLNYILEKQQYKNITAIDRIKIPDDFNSKLVEFDNLVNLEHKALQHKLFSVSKGAQLWWENSLSWCGEMQNQQRFRKSQKDVSYHLLIPDSEYEGKYWEYKNENVYPFEFGENFLIENDKFDNFGNNCDFWLEINERKIYTKLAKDFEIKLSKVGGKFGEVRLIEYEKTSEKYNYHPNLGLYKSLE